MVAVPFSLSLSSFDSTGPRRGSHPSQQSPSGRLFHTLPEHGSHVCDVVLLNGHREHRRSFRQWVADHATDFTEGPLSDEA
jgi:hypothetical protein